MGLFADVTVERPFTDPFSSADDDDDWLGQSTACSVQAVVVAAISSSSTLTNDDDKFGGSMCRVHAAPGRSIPEGFRARPSEERIDDVRRTTDDESLTLLLSPG